MHYSRELAIVNGDKNRSVTKHAKEHRQRSISAAAMISSTAYLDIKCFRQQREQVLSHVLVHMQPAAISRA